MVSDDSINKPFLEFLTQFAEIEVENSRIQDKESHYEAIQLYIELIMNKGEQRESQGSSEANGHNKNSVYSENDRDKNEKSPKNR